MQPNGQDYRAIWPVNQATVEVIDRSARCRQEIRSRRAIRNLTMLMTNSPPMASQSLGIRFKRTT
jgi:hypothetical protein